MNPPAPGKQCAQCQKALPADSCDQLCPGCLLRRAMTAQPRVSSMPDPGELLPESREFGDYELIEEIAHGGQGIVYKARQKSLQRVVAIKMLLLGPLANEKYLQRFRFEAIAAAGLKHPNIVQVHDVGLHEGQPFIVMEYIEGQNLARHLSNGPLPGRRAATYLETVAHAVHSAHEAGILHRDLKPSNILIDFVDEPHVADFGLARRLDGDGDVTLSGQMLGSPNYIPPEQAVAKRGPVGRTSDVYGLGAVLYHMLTGRPPFMGESVAETLDQTLNSELVRPRLLNPGIAPDLETICLKCLEKEPGRRYPSAEDLADDLRRFLDGEPIQARPLSPAERAWRWCHRKPALAIAGSVALLLFLIVAIGSPLVAIRINAGRLREVQERQRAEHAAQMAAQRELDARRTAYSADMLIAHANINDNNRGRAIAILESYRPKFEPGETNGAQTADLRGWEWYHLAAMTQGQELAVLQGHARQVNDVAFSPDELWVASCGSDATIKVWNVESGSPVADLRFPVASVAGESLSLGFSPDGKLLGACADLANRVLLYHVPSWKPAGILTNDHRVIVLDFSPDNRHLATAGHGNPANATVWDLERRTVVRKLSAKDTLNTVPALRFSPDAAVLFHDLGEGQLRRWDVIHEKDLEPLSLSQQSTTRLRFSEDGRLAALQTADGATEVWSVTNRTRLYHLTNETLLAVSSRLDRLVTGVNQEVHVRQLATGGLLHSMIGHTETLIAGAISPTRRLIATTSYDHTVRLWSLDPARRPKLYVEFPPDTDKSNGNRPGLSSDGKWAVSVSSNKFINIWSTTNLELRARVPWPMDRVESCAVASGGRTLAVGGDDGLLMLLDIATGKVRSQTRVESNRVYRLTFSTDGMRLAAAHVSKAPSEALRILDTADLNSVRDITPEGGTIFGVSFTPDHSRVAVSTYASNAEVFDVQTGRPLSQFRGHQGRVTGVAISADARKVASIATDGWVCLWDGLTGREIRRFRDTWEEYSAIAISPDGSRVAATSLGVDIWDPVNGRKVQTLRTTNETLLSLAWTPESDQLSATSATSLRTWPGRPRSTSSSSTNSPTPPAIESITGSVESLAGFLGGDLNHLMPVFDRLVLGSDPGDFWRRARATAYLLQGDLTRAAADNPAYAVPPRDPACTGRQLDLTGHYNCLLTADCLGGIGSDLLELPRGLQHLDGTGFDLRGVVVLAGTHRDLGGRPAEVKGIPVNTNGRAIHVLHATRWESAEGGPVGRYILHYEDGAIRELPIRYGIDIRNFWTVSGEPTGTVSAQVAWRGSNHGASTFGQTIRLWKRTYDNPRPDARIVSLDIISDVNVPAPFVVAITVE